MKKELSEIRKTLLTDVALSFATTHNAACIELNIYYTTIRQIFHLFVFNPCKVYYDEDSFGRGIMK